MSAITEQAESGTDPLLNFRRAVAEDLQFLALLQDRELDRDVLLTLWKDCYEDFLGLRFETEQGREALTLFRHGLTDIPTDLNGQTLDILAAEYADIYLNHSISASPCESVWLDDDHLIMQEPMFQIREWYQRYGLAVEDWRKRTDDHLVNQLRFLAYMIDPEAEGGGELADTVRFMDEHILRWISDFAERVGKRCQTRFYAGLAQLTAAYLSELRDVLAEVSGEARPTAEEIEERMRQKKGVVVEPPTSYVPGSAPSW